MSTEAFKLNEEDPILHQFLSGLEAWERPGETLARVVRTRGVVPTRGGVRRIAGDLAPGAMALPPDDPVLEQFRAGLEAWERPFDTGNSG
jgi:hypothetical protein